MCGHFTHCSHFFSPSRARKNTTQLVKYPRVLSLKPSNKVYVIHRMHGGLGIGLLGRVKIRVRFNSG